VVLTWKSQRGRDLPISEVKAFEQSVEVAYVSHWGVSQEEHARDQTTKNYCINDYH
jgi:hypothetical protein